MLYVRPWEPTPTVVYDERELLVCVDRYLAMKNKGHIPRYDRGGSKL